MRDPLPPAVPVLRICVLVVAVVAFAGVALVGMANRAPVQPGVGAALRAKNGQLVTRQEALRAAARDLSEQVCRSLEIGLRGRRDGVGRPAPPCPAPPSTAASNEELLAWLSEQDALLAALAAEPAHSSAGR